MRGLRTSLALGAALLALGAATAATGRGAAASCAPREASAEYGSFVERAVASNKDAWGGELLRARGGPTYAAARRFLAPLTGAMQWGGHTLTRTGSYYVPFSFEFTPYGSTAYALHVADGSEIITRHNGGPSLSIYVGNGRELYGSCKQRLQPARLASGWMPILQTAYADAAGVEYRQESFAGRVYGAYGAPSVVSFVRLIVDASHAKRTTTIRLVPWKLLAHDAPDRLSDHGKTRLIVSGDPQFVRGVVRYSVAKGETQTIYAEWLNQPAPAPYVHATAATYNTARRVVASFWQKRLAEGATFDVPEPVVKNAMRGILTQLIGFGWRYSIGNPYEELSYAESLDSAEIATEFGFPGVARATIELSLQRMRLRPWRFTAFRAGHILSTAALYYRLARDRAFLRKDTPQLAALVERIAARRITSGPDTGRLLPEALSTDLEGHNVDSVSGQIEAVEGLLAIGRVWSSVGDSAHAARARTIAQDISVALKPALAKQTKRLRDGSIFVPADLDHPRPYGRVTGSRDGSYWNLVMPYALASGWFTPHSPESRGILRYLLQHAARMLGIPRTYARTVYGNQLGAGLAPVYELSPSRLFADNDQPDQLVLSLYGMLAVGMTQNTYVSGEAVSVLPVDGALDRTMFMPPNTGANASYLGTLRELLIHERRGPLGGPAGLDLAFSTPRSWLASGKTIDVEEAPTSFGNVTVELTRSGGAIDGKLVLPANSHARLRLRVPAGETVTRVYVAGTSLTPDKAGTVDLGDLHGPLSVHATVG